MPRALRPRKSRPSYATLFEGSDGEDSHTQAGPSSAVMLEEDHSESDFAPEENAEHDLEDHADEGEDEYPDPSEAVSDADTVAMMDVDEEEDSNVAFDTAQSASTIMINKNKPKQPSMVQLAPGLMRPSNRQQHALPLPNVHHRHRAVPIHLRSGQVERLEESSRPFRPAKMLPTNSGTAEQQILDRTTKAWGYNVGPGPLWELMEDRAWFKEAVIKEGEDHEEANRRPRVHEGVSLVDGWTVLDAQNASSYLPTADHPTGDGVCSPPTAISCYFGPFREQQLAEVQMFDTLRMSSYFPGSKSVVFHAGASVWSLDWCPFNPNDREALHHKQYLAVGPFPSRDYSPTIGTKVQRPSPSSIQIWSLAPDERGEPTMACEMVLCVDVGPAHQLKWCPLPSGSDLSTSPESRDTPRKLGLLAGTFQDGSVSVFVIPFPTDVGDVDQGPIYVNIPQPIVRIELEHTSCWTLDWANSDLIAIGCTNGAIATYNVGDAIRNPDAPLLPNHYSTAHQSAIRALSWVKIPPASGTGEPLLEQNPTVLATGGYDGVERITDLRDPGGNMMNRTRDVVNFMEYSDYMGGVITVDHENIIKVYSLSPTMLGRGHTLLEPSGPAWTVGVSAYHPQLAVGGSDGSCLTTNMSRATRRGGLVPFLEHKIYQMDYSRKTGEYRMLEHFLPKETAERPNNSKTKSSRTASNQNAGAWSPEVAVHRVVWNEGNGLAGASWLASTTASGLCRVDWLEGRWLREKLPYGGVDAIRKERALSVDE